MFKRGFLLCCACGSSFCCVVCCCYCVGVQGTYHIQYADGDNDVKAPSKLIVALLKSSSASASAASSAAAAIDPAIASTLPLASHSHSHSHAHSHAHAHSHSHAGAGAGASVSPAKTVKLPPGAKAIDPISGKPICQYDDKCYRRNAQVRLV